MNDPLPWGVLTGVRPAKIVHRLMDQGEPADAIRELLQRRYGVSSAKAALLTEVAVHDRRLVPVPENWDRERREVSLYLGIPYCTSRCAYCSFPSALLPTDGDQIRCLLQAIVQDMQAVVKLLSTFGLTPRTLYIGGGTPTCLPGPFFGQLMDGVRSCFDTAALREFTVEAGRPDSISGEKLQTMRRAGATRISVNPQTMRQGTLDRIGRRHGAEETAEAMRAVRESGFRLVNMDLIAGLPGETAADMRFSLKRVLEMRPENITVHTLALKRGAELWNQAGPTGIPSPETVREMVDESAAQIRAGGWEPYYLYRQKNSAACLENVGYSLPGTECIYNVDMIEERRTILGMGPSAATKAVLNPEWRLESCHFPKDIPTYVKRIGELTAKRGELIKRLFPA